MIGSEICLVFCFVLVIILIIGYIWFNRCPNFVIDPNLPKNAILAPACGKVVAINETDNEVEIVIYLTIFDVHYQFYPIDGIIENTQHDQNGKFELVSYGTDKSRMNEKQITRLKTEKWGTITIKQIAGYFVRRIDFYNKPNDQVKRGTPLGKIHFGSRVDIILPKPVTIKIKKDEYLNGPDTIIGEFPFS